MLYITRHLEEQILVASRQYPVVMVCGQRQVGKSTMLHHLRESSRHCVTLDDAYARSLAERDPVLFFETYGSLLLIDEFQRVPSILLERKNLGDRKALSGENICGMYWLTGSQKFRMMEEDFQIMFEMGANTIRLSHYQYDQYFYNLCDWVGMLVWAEIPCITQHMQTEGVQENTLIQMTEFVLQDSNHPSILCWGLSEEIMYLTV